MKYRKIGLAAALTASFLGMASAANAQSSTEPGFTTGIPLYAPHLPVGLYVDLVPDLSIRDTDPDAVFKAIAPFFVLQTPWEVANARIMLVASPVYGEFKIRGGGPKVSGFYNVYVGAQGTWDLGNNWGLGVRLAGWLPTKGKLAAPHATFGPRIGVTYYSPKEHFTASLERGFTIDTGSGRSAANHINLDLTYTRTTNKVEYGVVSFMSADTERLFPGYGKHAQIAVGPLLGYNFPGVQVQGKFTTDIAQKNYGGRERRVEFNITIPLWMPKQAPAETAPN